MLFRVTADFADHDDGFGFWVVLELFDDADVGGADDGVSADTDAGGESDVGEFVHHLVSEGARFGYEADSSWVGGGFGWDDAGVGFAWADDSGAVRSDQAGAGFFGEGVEFGGVFDWDAFGDDDAQRDFCPDRFFHCVFRESGGDEDDGGVCPGGAHCFADGSEDRDGDVVVEGDAAAGTFRVHATYDVGAGVEHPLGMLLTFGSGHALDDDFRVFVKED